MVTSRSTVAFIQEQLAPLGDVQSLPMFGEFGLYCDGKLFALICDDVLFVKVTDAGITYAEGQAQASPYPGAKPHFVIEPDALEAPDDILALIRATVADLPEPKSKPKRLK